MFDLEQTIRERHSTRMFLPQQPVPLHIGREPIQNNVVFLDI